jgi:hypothetical protein
LWAIVTPPLVIAWRRGGWNALPSLATAVVVGLLALRVRRLQGFYALTNVLLLAPWFAALGPERLPLTQRPTRREMAGVGLLCLAGIIAAGFAVRKQLTCVTLTGSEVLVSWQPEPEAIAFLRDNAIEGKLLNHFNYGEMAIWHLAPKLKVSYDGRRETVYSTIVQDSQQRLYSDTPDVTVVRTLGADYIWLPHRLAAVGLLLQDGWIEVFRGRRSVVLGRNGGSFTQPAPWAGPRCFPGP